jgi:phospholipase/carboxylesterase
MDLNKNKDFITVGDKKNSDITVLWFHGYGSNNWSFEPVMKTINMNLGDKLFIVMPNAPIVNEKRSWYPLPEINDDDVLKEDYEGLVKSKDTIYEFFSILDLDLSKKLIVGGFSQGAALSLSLMFDNKLRIDGCVALSGYMPCEEQFTNNVDSNTKIFIAHGYDDKAISFESYKNTLNFLKNKSKNVTNFSGDFGHTIPKTVLDNLMKWLREYFV